MFIEFNLYCVLYNFESENNKVVYSLCFNKNKKKQSQKDQMQFLLLITKK